MAPPRTREIPQPGQESVWDYPRPPACVPSARHIVVSSGTLVIADTRAAWRVLETSHPPTWYLPPADIASDTLVRSKAGSTFCEWKGAATYWDVRLDDGRVLAAAAWSYENPSAGYAAITGYLAFSPSRLECTVDGEHVRAQEGGFYAGWITDDVVGPFKGGPGTIGW
jgi:uncharacterized protein (DUF427 family)